jgi:hypothetical protein
VEISITFEFTTTFYSQTAASNSITQRLLSRIEQTPCKGIFGKQIEEHVGQILAKYTYSPNGCDN